MRTVPPRTAGLREVIQKQLDTVETLLRAGPGNLNETASVGWLLVHERHQLRKALKYDERATSEWEAAHDWQVSAQEGPVSKIFVTHRSKFGLTPEQHRYRMGQASTLGNNAMDLWRFSDDAYKEACSFRRIREDTQNERATSHKQDSSSSTGITPDQDNGAETPTNSRDSSSKKDFQTWLKEVSKNGDEALNSVKVKDDGTLEKPVLFKQISPIMEDSLQEKFSCLALVEETDDDTHKSAPAI